MEAANSMFVYNSIVPSNTSLIITQLYTNREI